MTATMSLLNTIAPPDTLTRTTEASAKRIHSEATCTPAAFALAAIIAGEVVGVDIAAGAAAAAATAL